MTTYDRSMTFDEDFAALAEAVRGNLGIPDTDELRLPTVQALAEEWYSAALTEYRMEWGLLRYGLFRWIEGHRDGSRVLGEYYLWLAQHARPAALRGPDADPAISEESLTLFDSDPLPDHVIHVDDPDLLRSALDTIGRAGPHDRTASMEADHLLWTRATDELGIRGPNGEKLRHPLAPMVRGWFLRPIAADINRRPDRILPSRVAMVRTGDRRAPKLFSPAAHGALVNGEQYVLPGFELDVEGPALPLVLYDLGEDNPHQVHGRSAPLALRLFVEAILSVPFADRHRYQPVAMQMTLSELRDRLFPGRKISMGRVMQQLVRAVDALDSMDARIPWEDPETGRGGLRRIVSVQDVPRSAAHLDDVVRLIVDLPPGSGGGPVVTATLADWGVRSGPAYRALINLAYRWYQPGRTHYPLPSRDGGKHWVRKEDPSAYPEITESSLIELVFPTSTQRNRRVLVQRSRKVLAELEAAGELRVVDNRILPSEP